jgi:hypothetical protein
LNVLTRSGLPEELSLFPGLFTSHDDGNVACLG